MTTHRLVAASSLVAAAIACRAQESFNPSQLQKAITFDELRSDGTHRSLGNARHLEDLDYESELVVTPDEQKIRVLSGSVGSVLPPLTGDEAKRLEIVRDLLSKVGEAAKLTNDAAAELERADAARRAGVKLDAAAIAEVQRLLQAEADARGALLKHVKQALRNAIPGKEKMSEEDLDVAAGERLNAYTSGTKLDLAKVRAFLEQEMKAIVQQQDADVRRFESAKSTAGPAVGFRVRGRLVNKDQASPVHVENYDDVEESFSGKPPRISLGTEADRERLRQELAATSAILAAANDVRSGKIDFGEKLAALEKAVAQDFAALKNALKSADAPAVLKGLDAVLDAAIADAKGSSNTDAQKRLETLKNLVAAADAATTALEKLKSSSSTFSPDRLLDLYSEAGDVAKSVQTFFSMLDVATVEGAVGDLLSFVEKKLKESGGEALASLAPKTVAELSKQLDQLESDFHGVGLVVSALTAGQQEHAVGGAAAGAGANQKTVALDDLVPGRIHLNRTPADRNQELDVVCELVRREGETYKVVEQSTRTFKIDRFGLVSDLSADAAFVRLASEDHFRTAPAAAWTLHYRTPRDPTDSALEKSWRFWDPGVGLSVTGISTDKETFQAGVGAHVSLFHDVVKVGYGYNLSADSNHGYFFVAIGLFQAIRGIGDVFSGFAGTSRSK